MIKFDQFGGIAPKVDAEKLSGGMAQIAKCVDLAGGVLRPLAIVGELLTMNEEGVLTPGIPSGELREIDKPNAPTAVMTTQPSGVVAFQQMCRLLEGGWLKITGRAYAIHEEDGVIVEEDVGDLTVDIDSVQYTDNGLRIRAHLTDASPSFTFETTTDLEPRVYSIFGPVFEFKYLIDPSGFGGPLEALTFPVSPLRTDPTLPGGTVPLYYNGRVYAYMEIVDFRGPVWEQENIFYLEGTLHSFPLRGHDLVFTVNLNYVEPRVREYHFVSTHVLIDPDDSDVRYQGPPSELSEKIMVHPGEVLVVNTGRTNGAVLHGGVNLYQSIINSKDYVLVDEVDAATWTDAGEGTRGVELPPYGDWRDSGASSDDFLAGSFIHPAEYGVAFVGDTLWLSDVARLHAWPRENRLGFAAAIDAIALAGGTILVFSGGSVFGVNGSNPAETSKSELSASHPLLSALGLARIGQTVYWPTWDGLAACDGGAVRIVTEEQYTRLQWIDVEPEHLRGRSADGCILLEHLTDASVRLRIDLKEGAARVTTWVGDPAAPTLPWLYQSADKRFDKPVIIDYVRVVADDDVTLRPVLDGVVGSNVTVALATPVAPVAVTLLPAAAVGFQAESHGTVKSVELIERVIIPGEPAMRLTNELVAVWESIWIKFKDRDRPVCGSLATQDSGTAQIVFKNQAGLEPYPQNVASGHIFVLPRAEADMPWRDYWRIAVLTTAQVDELLLWTREIIGFEATIREINSRDGPAPWLVRRYEARADAKFKSLLVHAREQVKMRIYLNGAETATTTQLVSAGNGGLDGIELVLSGLSQARSIEFEFAEDNGDRLDHLVAQVTLLAQTMEEIGDGGIDVIDPPGWRNGLFKFPDRGAWACGSVGAETYGSGSTRPVLTLTKIAASDGSSAGAQAITISDGKMFLIPRTLGEWPVWGVDLNPNGQRAHQLLLKPRVREAVEGHAISLRAHDTGLAPWAALRFDFGEPVALASGRVLADSYPVTLRLFGDGAETTETPTLAITVEDSAEFLIEWPGGGLTRNLDFDFNGDDYKVNHAMIFASEPMEIGSAGLELPKAQGIPNLLARPLNFKETGSFSVARIVASAYPLTLRLARNGTLEQELAITSNDEVKLNCNLGVGLGWMYSVLRPAGVEVFGVFLVGRTIEPFEGTQIVLSRLTEPETWLARRFRAQRRISPSCGRVVADAYPVLVRLAPVVDGVIGSAQTISVRDSRPFRLPRFRPNEEWIVDVVAGEGVLVSKVVIATVMSGI